MYVCYFTKVLQKKFLWNAADISFLTILHFFCQKLFVFTTLVTFSLFAEIKDSFLPFIFVKNLLLNGLKCLKKKPLALCTLFWCTASLPLLMLLGKNLIYDVKKKNQKTKNNPKKPNWHKQNIMLAHKCFTIWT